MSALTDTFTAIANAIRGKLGVQTTYTPTQMSSAIASIPTAKEEQTKSVTATTSQQTVTPDTGKVLSSVTVNPQVHSATYTPTGYSNANDMGAQNNYRYVDTSAYEPTNITPSDSSPVSLSSGSIYKAGGNGYAIESQPTSITPSDNAPIFLSSSGIYKPSTSGYAIKNNPPTKTPSDTSPASVSNGQIIKSSAAGYLYKTEQTKSITLLGSITISDTNGHNVSLSKSIKNFRYCMVCFGSSVATDKVYGNSLSGPNSGSMMLFDTDKWVSGFSIKGGYTVGSGSSQSSKTVTVAYYSGSVMTITHNASQSRTDYIYGIN